MSDLTGATRTVLFVSPWEGIIGPNTGLRQLALEVIRRGHAAHCICPVIDEAAQALAVQGVTLHPMPQLDKTPNTRCPVTLLGHLRRSWRVTHQVAAIARQIRADVICINSENILLVPRAGRLAGCPVVAIMRGMQFAHLGAVGRVYFGLQQRWVNQYVAIVQQGAATLAQMGVPAEHITFVPNGVDVGHFTPRPRSEKLAAEFGIEPSDLVIGTLSHMLVRKGAHHLVEAMGELAGRYPNLKAVVAGGTTNELEERYEASVRRRIAELGLTKRFLLPGYRTDTVDLLNLMDLVVHPSETEACPRGVIEAQACGKAVVGFRVGGMPEVVAEGVTGLLAEPLDVHALAEATAQLLDNPQRRMEMGQAARRRVLEQYNLSINLGRLVNLLFTQADKQGGEGA